MPFGGPLPKATGEPFPQASLPLVPTPLALVAPFRERAAWAGGAGGPPLRHLGRDPHLGAFDDSSIILTEYHSKTPVAIMAPNLSKLVSRNAETNFQRKYARPSRKYALTSRKDFKIILRSFKISDLWHTPLTGALQ